MRINFEAALSKSRRKRISRLRNMVSYIPNFFTIKHKVFRKVRSFGSWKVNRDHGTKCNRYYKPIVEICLIHLTNIESETVENKNGTYVER